MAMYSLIHKYQCFGGTCVPNYMTLHPNIAFNKQWLHFGKIPVPKYGSMAKGTVCFCTHFILFTYPTEVIMTGLQVLKR